MNFIKPAKQFWEFLKKDTWQSWLVSILLIFVIIRLIFFPALSLVTGSSLPLVVVESCSLYHESDFSDWWSQNAPWYESRNITLSDFNSFNFKNGLNKGDIILVVSKPKYNLGNIIIFNSQTTHPIIHRIVTLYPLSTKGDHNADQLPGNLEKNIQKDQVIGKAVLRIPALGWVKLIFYDWMNDPSQRGLCNQS